MFTDSDEVSSVIDHTETDSNKVNPGTDKTDSHTDENERNAMELIAVQLVTSMIVSHCSKLLTLR